MATVVPFVPPPYPYERLDALKQVADALPGGVVDCSIGTPCDPVPDLVAAAAAAAATAIDGISAVGRHRRAARGGRGVDGPATRRRRRARAHRARASAPRRWWSRSRTSWRCAIPTRDTVLYPAVAYPSYEMGATLAGRRAVPVPLDADWHLDLDAISDADAERALVLWINEPGNPSSSVADAAYFERVAEWGRAHDVVDRERRVLRGVRARPAHDPQRRPRRRARGAQPLEALEPRGHARRVLRRRPRRSSHYLVETRKHAGFMVPTPAQAAAVAALGDDAHVEVQRKRYAERRDARASNGSRRSACVTSAERCSSTSGSATTPAPTAGRSPIVSRAPACSCRPATSTATPARRYARLALVQPASGSNRRSTDS